jgi:hypothetical protein
MKIRIARLSTDAQKKSGISEAPVGKCAAIVDDKAEAIAVDSVEIVGLLWLRQKGIFQVELAIGGYDSAEAFHTDPDKRPALVAWNRDQYPDLWARYRLEDYRTFDFDAVAEWLHVEGFLDAACSDIWRERDTAIKLESDDGDVIADYRPDVVARFAYVAPPPLVGDEAENKEPSRG